MRVFIVLEALAVVCQGFFRLIPSYLKINEIVLGLYVHRVYICLYQLNNVAMKNVIKQLEKQLEKLREIIQNREDKVDNMSEKWQESEACEFWTDQTMDIEEKADNLDGLIFDLKELL